MYAYTCYLDTCHYNKLHCWYNRWVVDWSENEVFYGETNNLDIVKYYFLLKDFRQYPTLKWFYDYNGIF